MRIEDSKLPQTSKRSSTKSVIGIPTEKEIETAILQFLEYVPGCFAWKNNANAVFDPTKKIFRKSKNRFAINGVSDILGVFNGKILAIEVKRPSNKKRNEDQDSFLSAILKNGGIAFYATSIDDVKTGMGL